MARGKRLLALLFALMAAGLAVAQEAPYPPTPLEVVKVYLGCSLRSWRVSTFSPDLVDGGTPSDDQCMRCADRMDRLFNYPPPATPRLNPCFVNLKNLGTALEIYSIDNNGLYPSTLQPLVPGCIKSLPVCPTNGAAYGYEVGGEPQALQMARNSYTLLCTGVHPGEPPGQPRYTSSEGLIQSTQQFVARPQLVEILGCEPAGVDVRGARASLRIRETFRLYGETRTVATTYLLVKKSGEWLIDAKASAPELTGETRALDRHPESWPDFRHRNVARYGVGKVILSFLVCSGSPAPPLPPRAPGR